MLHSCCAALWLPGWILLELVSFIMPLIVRADTDQYNEVKIETSAMFTIQIINMLENVALKMV
uniref:Uncharacterized protein n=1 Tax=Arundo donax TaxID=35708 RepID=A0A0A9GKC4_ARUDO